MSHRVERYMGGRDGEITAMVLAIQNGEYGLDLTVADQPDLADIPRAYAEGGFWVAIGADDAVIGSIGLLRYGAGLVQQPWPGDVVNGKAYLWPLAVERGAQDEQ
jgi:hypothetical protein